MTDYLKEQLEEAKNSAWSFLIKRRPIAWLLVLTIILFGSLAWGTLPRELQPEIEIPFAGVSAVLPGASPTDTESLLTEPLEKEIADVDNIKSLSSTSGFGFSSIFIEFESGTDIDKAVQEVKDKVDMVKGSLPDDATDPMVAKAEANSFPIITFSVSGDKPLYILSQEAKRIKDELEKIPGVSKVPILGDQEKQIDITLDQKKVEKYGFNINTISDQIKYSNNNLPIGLISSDKLNYSVRLDDRYQSLKDIQNIPLQLIPDQDSFTTILLKDIAEIREVYPEKTIISKVSSDGEKSLQSVSLQVFKKAGADLIGIAEDSKARIDELVAEGSIPQNTKVTVTTDNSVWIKSDLGVLTQNGIQTTIIIIVILFLALGFKAGLISGLSIPIIFLFSFIVLDIEGLSINSLSLFSLVIALGLMVDTTIVIMEGIYENLSRGLSPTDAAILSVYTYKWPLIAGTFTTVFAFFPMLLVSGILGEFLKTLPLTISAALLGSLFISLTIAPALATGFVKRDPNKEHGSYLEPIFKKIGAKFAPLIQRIIETKKTRLMIIFASIIAFILSLMLPISGMLKVEMFAQTDQNYFIVRIETPKGTVLEETKKIAEEIEEYVYKMPEVENFLTNIGTTASGGISENDNFGSAGATSDSNVANITINLTDKEERDVKSYEIAQELEEELSSYTKAKIRIEQISEGPPSDAAITARITGKDLDSLKEIANEVEKMINDIPGTTNTQQSLKSGVNEFVFNLDKEILAYHGLSSMQVAGTIRNIIQGVKTDTITFGDDELDIYTKYNLPTENEKINLSIHDIENFEIASPKGYMVSLGELGKYSFEESLSSIQREDEKRIIKVTSDIEKDADAVTINNQIEEKVKNLNLPIGYNIEFGGDMEEINESFQDLFKSMIVAVVLIGFTLILMFNSFRQAFVILATLPLALIGVFPGLMLVGLKLSFPAFLGVVALAGVVVNDAIVLVDRINSNRASKMEFARAIAEASNARLQPIIMTSVTTIVGILPLAITNEFWSGLGFSLIFGLAFSTILTLVVIPVLYYRMERKNAL
ncbi:efflux RND transporter permease subunit [Patescibacteria group bacterium]|nr:efflux RND transporter permease subunit [Patescibacteria group bacterium]